MASNLVFQRQEARGWAAGLSNLFSKELRDWWGTRTWLVHAILWLLIVNGLVALSLFSTKPSGAEETAAMTGLMMFFLFGYIAMGIGTIIVAQDEIVGEKQSGTAAWIMSKPVSRPAFLLGKLFADAVGILAVMVLFQGAIAFAQISFYRGELLSLTGMVLALGAFFLELLFFLCLTLMLGTLSSARGAILGVPIALIVGYQFILGLAPFVQDYSPYPLVLPLGRSMFDPPSIAMALATGVPVSSFTPVIATILWCLLFVGVAIWRFSREEF